MEKEQKFISVPRHAFYGSEGRRRFGGSLPALTMHPDDAPEWRSEKLDPQVPGIPIEYFVIPITDKGDWEAMPMLRDVGDNTRLFIRQNTATDEEFHGLAFTTLYFPQLNPDPDIDNICVMQLNAQDQGLLKRYLGNLLLEVETLEELFRQYSLHLPDKPPTIEVSEAVQAMLAQVPEGPLNGTLVVAFDQQIAGSLASEELARSGALVIKVEKPEQGDPKRANSSPNSFNTFNAGKFSVTFDDSAEGQKLKRDLLKLADVVVDNRSKGAQERDELLQEALKAESRQRPLIFCSIGGFERNDGRPAYDRVLQAESGMVELNGKLMPFPLVDMAAGKEAAGEVVKSLFRRERMSPLVAQQTPTIRLDVSMIGVALNMMANQVTTFIDTGEARSTLVPFDIYETQDGKISIAVGKDDQFQRLAATLGTPEIAQYDTNAKRLANRGAVEESIRAALLAKTAEEWITELQQQKVPAGPVRTLESALSTYGHEVLRATAGGKLFVGSPTTSNLYPRNPVIGDAPAHGQHTGDVATLVGHMQQHAGEPKALQDSIEVSSTRDEKHFQRKYRFVDAHEVDFSGDQSNVSWLKGKFFYTRKVGEVTARKAEPYEVIDVVHRDELEVKHLQMPWVKETKVSEAVSKHVAVEGDWVVTTKFGDTFVRTDEQFRHSYVEVEDRPGTFKPNPDLPPRKTGEVTENVRFMSPSGDITYIPAGGWLREGSKGNYGIHPNNIEGENYEVSKWTGKHKAKKHRDADDPEKSGPDKSGLGK